MRCHTAIAFLTAAAGAATAFAQGPTPIIPAGFEAPGPYPNTVCGAVINMRNVASPQEPDQGGEDNMFFTVPGSGPFFWTSSRNNGGDFGLNISPFYGPSDPRSLPPQPANNFRAGSAAEFPFDGTTYAWRLGYGTGVSFATPRSNGTANRFTYNGAPIILHYTASIGNSSTAQGYSLFSGFHTLEETSQTYGCDLLLGCAGIPDRQEAVGNVAVAYFPFEQGWIGGHWDNAFSSWQDGVASSPNLPTSAVAPQSNSSFFVSLAGVNSATDGMLFVNSTQTNSNLKTIGAYPNNGGWTVFMRDDEDTDLTGLTPPADLGINFSFVYVPYNAARLIGARINGDTGATITGAGSYTMTRLSEGRYALTLPGENDITGALVITSSGLMAGTTDLPDRTFFSYQFDTETFRFIIESREIVSDANTPWGRTPTLRDSDFSFVWVDFTNPLAPAGDCAPDWNNDGAVNSQDFFDFLTDFFAVNADYNNDGFTNSQDFFDFLSGFFIGC